MDDIAEPSYVGTGPGFRDGRTRRRGKRAASELREVRAGRQKSSKWKGRDPDEPTKKELRRARIADKRMARARGRGFDVERVAEALAGFVEAEGDIHAFEPMCNAARRQVHILAAAFGLQSTSQGSGKKRFSVISQGGTGSSGKGKGKRGKAVQRSLMAEGPAPVFVSAGVQGGEEDELEGPAADTGNGVGAEGEQDCGAPSIGGAGSADALQVGVSEACAHGGADADMQEGDAGADTRSDGGSGGDSACADAGADTTRMMGGGPALGGGAPGGDIDVKWLGLGAGPSSAQTGKAKASVSTPSRDFGAFERHGTGFGSRMLEKMGWKAGEGVGKKRDGIAEPVKALRRQKSMGLGFE
eukprot:PRCOL_00005204-RA